MKKLCSKSYNNHENELEMVLEVSLPEEKFTKTDTNAATKRWQHMFNLVRPQKDRAARWLTTLSSINDGSKDKEFMYFLKISASSFIPYQVQLDHALSLPVRDGSIVRIIPLIFYLRFLPFSIVLIQITIVSTF